jgi:UDP-N-acetyl-D-glucosamine/UDP-N-acetyl-D-galactosamine dehydrogenase
MENLTRMTSKNIPSLGLETVKIGVIGLGYVGLPLAVLLATKFPVVGFDLNAGRIAELKAFKDRTLEVESSSLAKTRASFSNNPEDLAECNFYVVTVPTPIDDARRPNLVPLMLACRTIGKVLSKGDVVVFESTVYPGVTEDECVPVIAEVSGLTFNQDFVVGYSPERVNPGDKTHTIDKIVKITSGSTEAAADLIDRVYASVITAGTYKAATIKVAEAAKIIENTQRDVNIALVNELSNLFNKLGIDTLSVIDAAKTKWNFLPFRPGLVGGHCVGVDPYYLTHKAQQVGHHPEIILAGRRINDLMGEVVASRFVRFLVERGVNVATARLLILGFTFKENCTDIRNTRVIDVVNELRKYGCEIDVHDPWADAAETASEYGINLVSDIAPGVYDGCILAVAHDQYRTLGSKGIRNFLKPNAPVFDVKGILPKDESDLRL